MARSANVDRWIVALNLTQDVMTLVNPPEPLASELVTANEFPRLLTIGVGAVLEALIRSVGLALRATYSPTSDEFSGRL